MQSSSTKGRKALRKSSSCSARGGNENHDTIYNTATALACGSTCRLRPSYSAGVHLQAESGEQVLLARSGSRHPLSLALVLHERGLSSAGNTELPVDTRRTRLRGRSREAAVHHYGRR